MKKVILLLGVLGVAVSSAWAEDKGTERVRQTVAALIPQEAPRSIEASVLPGIYEVVYDSAVLYVSADGRYMLQGDVVDLEKRRNLTEGVRAKGRVKVLNSLAESDMIVFAPKKVKHTVTVFTDIDCAYCRKLHSEMDKYTAAGIKIRYAAYPRAGVGSDSYEKAVSVWCAKDRRQAMTAAKAGQAVERKSCDKNPVGQHFRAAQALNLNGTPNIVLNDGQVIFGYVPADELVKLLDRGGA